MLAVSSEKLLVDYELTLNHVVLSLCVRFCSYYFRPVFRFLDVSALNDSKHTGGYMVAQFSQ